MTSYARQSLVLDQPACAFFMEDFKKRFWLKWTREQWQIKLLWTFYHGPKLWTSYGSICQSASLLASQLLLLRVLLCALLTVLNLFWSRWGLFRMELSRSDRHQQLGAQTRNPSRQAAELFIYTFSWSLKSHFPHHASNSFLPEADCAHNLHL